MRSILLWFFVALSVGVCAQDMPADTLLVKPSEGKCMVYIARRGSKAMLIKYKIYDGDIFLGKLGTNKYFAYECDPGLHVFVGKSENTSYLEANLKAGNIYVIEALSKIGYMTSQVELKPLDHTHKKYAKEKKNFLNFILKKKGELLVKGSSDEKDNEEEDVSDVANGNPVGKNMKKYYEMKEKNKKINTMTPEQYFK